jgi:pimeloyl-ACP methyl ester carboxylesterase
MRPEDLSIVHRYATTNGMRMHYVEAGRPGDPLVLLLHGFPEFWWSWRHQLQALAAAGFRVVAPDQRGYADSDKQGPYDLDTLSEDVAGLLESLGQKRAMIVGHDWGGAVAWHLAATRPELCSRLVILNSPHPVIFKRALFGNRRQMKRSWYMFFFQLPWLPERLLTRRDASAVVRLLKGNAVRRGHLDDETLAPYREAMRKPGAASGMLGWYRNIPKAAMRPRDGGRRFPTIEAPTLLLWGMRDRALGFEDVVPGTEKLVRDLAVERIEDAGHFVQSDAPDEVNEKLLAFLGKERTRRLDLH